MSNYVSPGDDEPSEINKLLAKLKKQNVTKITQIHDETIIDVSEIDTTDPHTTTTKLLGIQRDAAKLINYAAMHGATQEDIDNMVMKCKTIWGVDKNEEK